jgi:hypothetical protein
MAMNDQEIFEQVQIYENQLNQKLKPDLKQLLDYRDTIYEQISNYLNLKNKIQLIIEKEMKKMETMINLGSDFYVQANMYELLL